MRPAAKELSTDTRRLEPEDLSTDQLLAIQAIEERLRRAQGSDFRIDRSGCAKYLAFAEDRHPRVLLLDGDRGTGKTSFMLTLVDRWNPSQEQEVRRRERQEEIARRGSELGAAIGSPPTHVRVLDILDFDPLPPGMPLIAALVQAWRPLVEEYDRLHTASEDPEESGADDLLIDDWHRLFATTASGWNSATRSRSLVDQVLDREDQVRDWHEVDWHWRTFIGKVIERGTRLKDVEHRLSQGTVFVIMIDDCDLQVDRVRELLPALRLLYHPRMFFLVAADRPHMIDMLRLDFLGQQNKLAGDAPIPTRKWGRREWAQSLAEASFEKVFPVRNRFVLRKLSLRQLLNFQVWGHTFKSILADMKQDRPMPSKFESMGDYLDRMSGPVDDPLDLPRIWTHRTAHQIGEDIVGAAADPTAPLHEVGAGPSAVQMIARIIGHNERSDLVRIVAAQPDMGNGQTPDALPPSRLEFLQQGRLEAFSIPDFEEDTTQSAMIVLSAQPHLRYYRGYAQQRNPSDEERENSPGKMSAILALSMQEDGFRVAAPRLQWDARLALVWTRMNLANHELSLRWPFYRHPSPLRLLNWAKDWSEFVAGIQASENRPDRIAYAWIFYQLIWASEEGLKRDLKKVEHPLSTALDDQAWEQILKTRQVVRYEGESARWTTQTLPLLARPEIGLSPELQKLLLSGLSDKHKKWLRQERRKLITDAIYAAADESQTPRPQDANQADLVEAVIYAANQRYHGIYGKVPWNNLVEDQGPRIRGFE